MKKPPFFFRTAVSVEHSGFEPLTPTLPVLCATSCANAPYDPPLKQQRARGLYWTRTSDPIDVNDVLYQLSQQTIICRRCEPDNRIYFSRWLGICQPLFSLFSCRMGKNFILKNICSCSR